MENRNDDTKSLLLVWMENSKRAQIAHYESSNKFSRLNYWLGIPVVILTAVVGTSVFASLEKQVDPYVQILIGLISVLAAVLASLQTFLRFSERSSKHQEAASEFEAIKRTIQETLVIEQSIDSSVKSLNEIRKRMDDISKSAPVIPTKMWNIACKRVPFSKNALSYEKNKNIEK